MQYLKKHQWHVKFKKKISTAMLFITKILDNLLQSCFKLEYDNSNDKCSCLSKSAYLTAATMK